MKIAYILPLAICLFFIACEKEEGLLDGYDHPCDYALGRFEYLPTSLEKIAYENRNAVFFIDSFGNNLEFTIRKNFPSDKQAIERWWPGMMRTYYCYESQPIEFFLINDSLDIALLIKLSVNLNSLDPLEKLIADEVIVRISEK